MRFIQSCLCLCPVTNSSSVLWHFGHAACSGNPPSSLTTALWPSSCNNGSTASGGGCSAVCDPGYSGSVNATCTLGAWDSILQGACTPDGESVWLVCIHLASASIHFGGMELFWPAWPHIHLIQIQNEQVQAKLWVGQAGLSHVKTTSLQQRKQHTLHVCCRLQWQPQH